jgi:predicted DNA-binding helix-hairpin-helix protein
MVISTRLDTLVNAAQFDTCGYRNASQQPSDSPLRFIYRAALPEGGTVCLFKVLLTNVCLNDCAYCVNQVSRDVNRASFSPIELSNTFMEIYRKGLAHGLFLSSGMGIDSNRTMQNMIETAQILRFKRQYKGYVHLKILPGAKIDYVEEACKVANRVSINMEAPTAYHMGKLSRKKDLFNDILMRMRWIQKFTDSSDKMAPSGQTTQFVVGAADETDHDILRAITGLYKEVGLRRAYFSAFQPITHSPLEEHPPTPLLREHRLYQADWLTRIYNFPSNEVELALQNDGNLSLHHDPKELIAEKQPWLFPVDINRATRDELLRVPGIGLLCADRIIKQRNLAQISSLKQLHKMGVTARKSIPYIWFKGMLEYDKQLAFQMPGVVTC